MCFAYNYVENEVKMKYYKRESYLQKIRGFYDEAEIIKVITGVRRCGKSSLMQTIADEISEKGIAAENIIYLNLDKRGYRSVKTPEQLEKLIDENSKASGLKYLFIDEVQNVKDFEEVLNEFRDDGEFSIFITGSNSYLLSGELITKLTGRYIEFEMFPLNFNEYLEMKKFFKKNVSSNLLEEFDNYLIEGGFPKAVQFDSIQDKRTYISSVITEIFEKDIKRRVKVKNTSVFNKVQQYLINNFGSTTSLTNILSDLEKSGMRRVTIWYFREDINLSFISSPDGIMLEKEGHVNLLGRAVVLSSVMDSLDGKRICNLPYQKWMYKISTKGQEFEK